MREQKEWLHFWTTVWKGRWRGLHTEYRNDFVILNDLERPRHDKAERVEALALVEDNVARCTVVHAKVECQSSQTSVAGETKGRLFLEHFAMQVNTNVGLHVIGTVFEHLDIHCRHSNLTN